MDAGRAERVSLLKFLDGTSALYGDEKFGFCYVGWFRQSGSDA
ncbi:hypothetical protein ARZXY2_534 [Arthrobacter sp. ZXY-2]|nr:hypothetical protein ARZXY2_534 [Arthrobacter sp. ZXY-2]